MHIHISLWGYACFLLVCQGLGVVLALANDKTAHIAPSDILWGRVLRALVWSPVLGRALGWW